MHIGSSRTIKQQPRNKKTAAASAKNSSRRTVKQQQQNRKSAAAEP